VTDDVDLSTNGVDDRSDVAELGLDRVRLGVRARSATATIDSISGPATRELRDDRRPPRVIGGRAVNEHHRRPVPSDMAADHRPIRRVDPLELVAHAETLSSAQPVFKHSLFARGADVAAGSEDTRVGLIPGVSQRICGAFAMTLLGAALVIDSGVMAQALGHDAGIGDYAALAWMASSLGTIAGGLGAGLESDEAVREAAYGSRAERTSERESRVPARA
jgi:hypothetical protein